jgi:hypothetical protein
MDIKRAKLSEKRFGIFIVFHEDGTKSYVRRYTARVSCECGWSRRVGFGYWSALFCGGCRSVLKRPIERRRS